MLKLYKKLMLSILVVMGIALITFGYCFYQFVHTPINITKSEELIIPPGATIARIGQELKTRNIIQRANFLRGLAWYRGDTKKIKAGEYLLEANLTPIELLQKMVAGQVIQHGFTIIEGWSFKQLLAALQQQPKITNTLAGYDKEQIIKVFLQTVMNNKMWPIADAERSQNVMNTAVVANLQDSNKNSTEQVGINLEGVFWPDTYFYTAGTTDLELLLRSYKIMQGKLQQEWQNRGTDLQISSPQEALVLASILEKEASIPEEYYTISGVYQKRLQKNMSLQADPTVIYALNQAGNFIMPLKTADLAIDSPYNTYKYPGLPPTPIAIPSYKALHAALHPIYSEALYFVADGKGGHIFSATLPEHNKAVAEYRKKLASSK
jgi:UPF0755 protein